MKNLTKWAVVEKGPLTASGQDEILLTAKTQREARTMAQAAGYINNPRSGGVTYDLVRLDDHKPIPAWFEGIEFSIEARTTAGLTPGSAPQRIGQVVRVGVRELHSNTAENLQALILKHTRDISRDAIMGPDL